MSKKNAGFAADLVAGMDPPAETPPRRASLGVNVLAGRTNRLAELASGSAVTRTHELVDPARCRMREGHKSEEHTSELQSIMSTSYAVFCLKTTNHKGNTTFLSIIH